MTNDPPPVDYLVAHFERYLAHFEADPPFRRSGQLRSHVRTIGLRRKLGSASAALGNDAFLDNLAETLKAWGVGSHDAMLVDAVEFRRQMRKQTKEIVAIEGTGIHNADTTVGERLWRIVRSLDIVVGRRTSKPTQSKIVGGSKALHHVLPELMPPIDRTYTAPFLKRTQPQHFQNPVQEAETFRIAFESFCAIAKKADPAQYVGRHNWDTSSTKIIDNAIVGLIRSLLDQAKGQP
jgi:hypothetical protein